MLQCCWLEFSHFDYHNDDWSLDHVNIAKECILKMINYHMFNNV
jgi:hypothetical protein